MSEEALAPTASNFDAIVARNTARAEASASSAPDNAPDTQIDDAPDFFKLQKEGKLGKKKPNDPPPRVDDPEPAAEPEYEGDEEDPGERETEPDPLAEPEDGVEAEIRAPLKAMREALKSKKLTPELMEVLGDLSLEIKLPGGARAVKLRELPTGFMLQSRFNREMEKAKDIQARSNNIVQIEQARTASWRSNPAALLQGLQMMGCEESLNHVWKHLTEQRFNYLKASPEERQRIQYQRQLDQQLAQERFQRQQAQQELEQYRRQQQQQQIDPVTKQIDDHITSNMDAVLAKAFKQHGVPGRAVGYPQQLFLQNLRLMSEDAGEDAYNMLDEHMEAAASLAAEAYKEMLQAGMQQQRRQEPRELPARRQPAGTAPARDESGRFQAPRTNGKKAKPTVDEWSRRFAR